MRCMNLLIKLFSILFSYNFNDCNNYLIEFRYGDKHKNAYFVDRMTVKILYGENSLFCNACGFDKSLP